MTRRKSGTKDSPAPAPVIVKKVTLVAAGHHGGAWKVAYADFVTAMMAFFLLLWLLGATTEKQRKGIADYFTPTLVKMKEGSAGANGLAGGASLTDVDNYPHRQGQTGTRTITIPRDTTGGPKEGARRQEKAERLREKLQAKLDRDASLARFSRQVRIRDSAEGVRIDLVDNADFSMFSLGTTVLTREASQLLKLVADTIRGEGGTIAIRGHTDALPWKDRTIANNWSLSAGRAEATRQELIRDGINPDRFQKIEGVADRELLLPDVPHDPRNRRISILLGD
ncbi:MAG: flagellar motor protein MotB [Sphingomonadaceae bacterium]